MSCASEQFAWPWTPVAIPTRLGALAWIARVSQSSASARSIQNRLRLISTPAVLHCAATVVGDTATGGYRDHFLAVNARMSSHVSGPELTAAVHTAMGAAGRPRWLLNLRGHEELVRCSPHLRDYLASGAAEGIDTRHLASKRTPWYAVEAVQAPDIFLTPMARHGHRIIENCIGALGSNNLYGIYVDAASPWTRQELADWLRSQQGQEALLDLGRHYQGGTVKIEPKSLRALMIPIEPGRVSLF